jgi:hypothetical protein
MWPQSQDLIVSFLLIGILSLKTLCYLLRSLSLSFSLVKKKEERRRSKEEERRSRKKKKKEERRRLPLSSPLFPLIPLIGILFLLFCIYFILFFIKLGIERNLATLQTRLQ